MELRIYLSLVGLMFTLELFSCSPAPKYPRNLNSHNISGSKPNMALISGTEDTKRKYDFMVRVGDFDDLECGGALVAELWVTTSGYCANTVEMRNKYEVHGGGTYEVDEQTRKIVSVFSTNDDPYNPLNCKVGLLELEKKFDKGVSYIKIAHDGWPEGKKEKCTYVEYGKIRDGDNLKYTHKVYYQDLEFGRNDDSCGCWDKETIFDTICYKVEKNKGPCSCNGGSMICGGILTGHMLFTYPTTGKCGSGDSQPGDDRCGRELVNIFFSNIGYNLKWILSNSKGEISQATTERGGGGGRKKNGGESSINKSNSYVHAMFILYLVFGGLKSDFN